MKINQVSSYVMYGNYKNKVQKKNCSNVSFNGSATEVIARYKKAFDECYNLKFFTKYGDKCNIVSSSTARDYLLQIVNLYDKLSCLGRYNNLPKEFNDAKHPLSYLTYPAKRFNNLAEKIRLGEMQSKTLAEHNGKELFGIYNLGKYSTGLFSKSDHNQIVFQFQDPSTDRFIGISPSVDGGLALTRGAERIEFHDASIFSIPIRAISHQGYQPSVYDAAFTYDGCREKAQSTGFWNWFNNL